MLLQLEYLVVLYILFNSGEETDSLSLARREMAFHLLSSSRVCYRGTVLFRTKYLESVARNGQSPFNIAKRFVIYLYMYCNATALRNKALYTEMDD